MRERPLVVALAVALDLLFGEPPRRLHPVVAVGRFAAWLEGKLHRPGLGPLREVAAGGVVVLAVAGAAVGGASLVVRALRRLPSLVRVAAEAALLSTTFSIRELVASAHRVAEALEGGDLPEARRRVGEIVGRETSHLPAEEVVRAAVESVAENVTDAVTAPLFYAFLGGLPLAMGYRAVNTLDAMVGHRSPRYVHFGRAAARLDDALNFLPARLAVPFFPVAAWASGLDAKRCWATLLRDGRKHPSPNAGIPEAAVAGALGVRLGGVNVYEGRVEERPFLGEAVRPLAPGRIREATRVAAWVALLASAAGCAAGVLWGRRG
jgi:adenosylcobinamide-phosphate synthase